MFEAGRRINILAYRKQDIQLTDVGRLPVCLSPLTGLNVKKVSDFQTFAF